MEIFWFSFNAVTPLILIVALGYLLKQLKVIDDTFIAKANGFCFKVALPIALFNSIIQTDLQAEINWRLYAFVIAAILLIVFLLLLAVPRIIPGNPQRGAFIQGVYRGNFLLMGLLLARNLFGEEGVGPTAMLIPAVIALYNVLAVFLLQYYDDTNTHAQKSKVFIGVITNPLIIGSLAGVMVALLPFKLPLFLSRATSDIAMIASPLALVLLGGQFNWRQAAGNFRLLAAAVSLRMVIIPILVIGLAVLFGFRGSELGAIFILFCAPTAVTSYIMARSMNSDAPLAGQIILATTLVSGFTLFIGSYLLRVWQLI